MSSVSYLRNICLIQGINIFFIYPRSFKILGFAFTSVIHLESILHTTEVCWKLIFCIWLSNWSSNTYWKDCPFSTDLTLHFWQKSIVHICVDLMLTLHSLSLISLSVDVLIPYPCKSWNHKVLAFWFYSCFPTLFWVSMVVSMSV